MGPQDQNIPTGRTAHACVDLPDYLYLLAVPVGMESAVFALHQYTNWLGCVPPHSRTNTVNPAQKATAAKCLVAMGSTNHHRTSNNIIGNIPLRRQVNGCVAAYQMKLALRAHRRDRDYIKSGLSDDLTADLSYKTLSLATCILQQ